MNKSNENISCCPACYWFRGNIEKDAVVSDSPYGMIIFRKPEGFSDTLLDQIIKDHNIVEALRVNRKLKETYDDIEIGDEVLVRFEAVADLKSSVKKCRVINKIEDSITPRGRMWCVLWEGATFPMSKNTFMGFAKNS